MLIGSQLSNEPKMIVVRCP